MSLRPLLAIAWASALNRRGTLALVIAGIALATALLLGLERLRTDIREGFATSVSGTDLVVGARTSPIQLMLYAVFRVGGATNNISMDSLRAVEAHRAVAWVVPLSLGDSHRGRPVLGTSTAYFEHFRHGDRQPLVLAQGRAFAGTLDGLYEAVIGAEVAEALGYTLGERIVLSHGSGGAFGGSLGSDHADKPFTVVGVLARTGTPVDRTVHVSLEALEAIHLDWAGGAPIPGLAIPAEAARKFDLSPKQATAALVGLKNRVAVFNVQRFVAEYEAEPLMAVLPGVALAELWQVVGPAEQSLLAISGLVAVVSLASLVAVVLAGLNERRRELAVLRAVGAGPRQVLLLLAAEGVMVTLAGALAGVLIAALAVLGAGPLLQQHFGILLSTAPPTAAQWGLLGAVLAAGMLASLVPGWRAYRLSLADGLSPQNMSSRRSLLLSLGAAAAAAALPLRLHAQAPGVPTMAPPLKAAPAAAAAGGVRTIQWEELVPADWDPFKDFKDLNFQLLDDGDPRANALLKKMREVWDAAPHNPALVGQQVRIPGFIVPLEDTKDGLKEFLLVPYFGACIHSPPPPANQIIHVLPRTPAKGFRSMDTVWVSGPVAVTRTDSYMGVSTYRIEATAVTRYEGAAALRPPAPQAGRDLARITFGVLFIGLLLGVSLWVLRPFLGPVVWATMVVVASWPLMLRVQAWVGGRRWLAVTLMTIALLLLFVVPLVLAIVTIVASADQLIEWARLATTWRLPDEAPAWLRNLPVVGSSVDGLWAQLGALGLRDLVPRLSPYAGDLTRWFVAEVGSVGVLVLQFLLTVLIAAVMYAHGEEAARQVRLFARRLAGERGDGAVLLAGGAIRGVALGVGGTALVQALMGGFGLVVAGVPAATLLTALMLMLCIAQIGPVPVLLGAAAWVFYDGSTGWAIALLVWAGIVGTIDNVVRPVLIRLGADLPLILIFAGVIGGLFAFGLVGIFVGPVVLAVGYTLLEAWMHEQDPPAPPLPPEYRD